MAGSISEFRVSDMAEARTGLKVEGLIVGSSVFGSLCGSEKHLPELNCQNLNIVDRILILQCSTQHCQGDFTAQLRNLLAALLRILTARSCTITHDYHEHGLLSDKNNPMLQRSGVQTHPSGCDPK